MGDQADRSSKIPSLTEGLLIISVLMGLCIVETHSWDQNVYLQLTTNISRLLNLSNCWVCAALPSEDVKFPLFGIPVSYANWSWPYDNLNNSTLPTGENLIWKLDGPCAEGQDISILPNGETMCWGLKSPLPKKKETDLSYSCGRSVVQPLKFDLQVLGKPIFIKRVNETAPKVGNFNFNLSDINGTKCTKKGDDSSECPVAVKAGLQLDYTYDCVPDGLWWLCGDGHARKSLPHYWDGSCTLGYLVPQDKVFNHSHPPPGILRSPWKLVKREVNNSLTERETGFRSFVRWLFPHLGVSELGKAIVNISATIEQIENLTAGAIQGIQQEVSSLGKVVSQNRMGLDMLLAKEEGLCMVINQTCCTYINHEKRVETDLNQIWEKTKVLHQVAEGDTSFGFTEL